MATHLSAEDLLSGGAATYTVRIPATLLRADATEPSDRVAGEIVLRPLLVRDVDRVVRAAKEQRVLTSVLMVQQALVSPQMTVEQVGSLPAGLVQFLSERTNAI